jgi:hypothetical protein
LGDRGSRGRPRRGDREASNLEMIQRR